VERAGAADVAGGVEAAGAAAVGPVAAVEWTSKRWARGRARMWAVEGLWVVAGAAWGRR